MLSQSEMKRIAAKVFSLARQKRKGQRLADEVEVGISEHDSALTRYANNMITQNVSSSGVGLSVRLVKKRRSVSASTNKVDDKTLKQLVQDTAELIRYQKQDRNLLPMLGKQKYEVVDAFVEETATVSPHERVEGVRLAVSECEKHQLSGSGIFSNGSSSGVLVNAKGLFAAHQSSNATFTCTASGNNSSGWTAVHDRDVTKIRPLNVARTAVDKAVKSQDPVALPAGKYTVILEPAAVSNILGFLSYGFNALSYREGRNWLSGRLGKKVMGDNITLTDDVYHPDVKGSSFDGEGTPRQKVVMVEQGVAKNLVYDRETGRKAKKASTGHGSTPPNPMGPMPSSLILSPGDSSIEEMIATTKKGILVTEFHYANMVEPMKVVVTGMTRNGTFLIEDGKIARGIKNMRITESLLKALSNTEMISKETRNFGAIVPALKIRDFNFSSETKF